ncbi:hypothetical protein NG798_26765 [Ancylothrix sp. C2]|uniref:hypothetical protein n=1 Tax=Ancylothrix sp. D3o TaxID=2953691 RepID=UPI0021BB3A21|nr:hypothetical protein [Ancylothrix sp. D3o]MCT7953407.1 hypothetical protein [Ancylothrix sp. D3o]
MLLTILLSKLLDIYYGLPALLCLTSNASLCIFAAPASLELPSNHRPPVTPPSAMRQRPPATSHPAIGHETTATGQNIPNTKHQPPDNDGLLCFTASPTAIGHFIQNCINDD